MQNSAQTNHKDSLSRLSEAIELLKSKKINQQINETEVPSLIPVVKNLNGKSSEILLEN